MVLVEWLFSTATEFTKWVWDRINPSGHDGRLAEHANLSTKSGIENIVFGVDECIQLLERAHGSHCLAQLAQLARWFKSLI